MAAFVLHYRLPPKVPAADVLADGLQAVRWVRSHASEYGVSPAQVGIWGFSAGGHLASAVATHFGLGDRPDFQVLVYPVISMDAALAHAGSRENLLGPNPTTEQIALYSNDLQVTARTPPAFVLHSMEDPVVKWENSQRYAAALAKAGVPVELHLFQHGQHGEGLAAGDAHLGGWPDLLQRWLQAGGWPD